MDQEKEKRKTTNKQTITTKKQASVAAWPQLPQVTSVFLIKTATEIERVSRAGFLLSRSTTLKSRVIK